jgi:Na+-translocating ferredoxin:NAD+ oxidoreductase RnfD subunit
VTPTRLVTASPHLAADHTTPGIMWSVVLSLVPVIAAAIWFFGPSAILVRAPPTHGGRP